MSCGPECGLSWCTFHVSWRRILHRCPSDQVDGWRRSDQRFPGPLGGAETEEPRTLQLSQMRLLPLSVLLVFCLIFPGLLSGTYTFGIVTFPWETDPLITSPSLSLINVCALKSALSDTHMVMPASFGSVSASCFCLCPFTSFLSKSLYLKWISHGQHIVVSFFSYLR